MSGGGSSGFDALHPKVQRWIWDQGWSELRPIQLEAIGPIAEGRSDVIVSAATASGKTEAAWLPICSAIARDVDAETGDAGIKALYISPLKALINDQFDRLQLLCETVELPVNRRHGDVSGAERKALSAAPDGLMLMTPESLEALFVHYGTRVPSMFAGLRYIVIDEMHSFMGAERGAQLQSLMHRIELAIRRRVPRVGLSATLADPLIAADFLRPRMGEGVVIVTDASSESSELRLQVRGYESGPRPPKRDRDATGAKDEGAVEYSATQRDIARHLFGALRGRDNLVFANSRAGVEAYADMLREASEQSRVPNEFFPHHGSLSKQFREDVEARLKSSDTPTTAVCTSTLEMGIDIGSTDSVAQLGAPSSVAALRQRVGRSGRRGGPAVLRIYIEEATLDAQTSITDRLRVDLVQAVAVVELMLERWYEPPASNQLHFSTLVQQLLSVIAQHGGASAAQLYSALCSDGPFRDVTREQFLHLLRDLGAAEVLMQASDGLLLPGLVGERLLGHYSFYAAFHSSDDYRLLAAGQTLGTMPVDFPVLPGSLLIFAGRRWSVIAVDSPTKTIELAPSKGGNAPRFGHGGSDIADGIRRKMRELYVRDEVPGYLDGQGRSLYEQAQTGFSQQRLAESPIVEIGDSAVLFIWRGSRICHTISVMLAAMGIENGVEDMTLVCKHVDAEELIAILGAIADLPEPSALDLAQSAAVRRVDKHDEFIGETLLAQASAARDFDVKGALTEIRAVLGHFDQG